jgi:hypothetical protein
MSKQLLILVFLLLLQHVCVAQEKIDTVIVAPSETQEAKAPGALSVLFKGKPGKALVYSLMLPGAGQVYNKRYWKVPIIYAGLGLMVYFIDFNSRNYTRFDNAYRQRVDIERFNRDSMPDPQLPPTDEFANILTLEGINSYRQYYDKNLQLSIIGIVVVYLLNGIEAFVDRHLQEFDVSKNLSFQYTPNLYTSGGQVSLKISF